MRFKINFMYDREWIYKGDSTNFEGRLILTNSPGVKG